MVGVAGWVWRGSAAQKTVEGSKKLGEGTAWRRRRGGRAVGAEGWKICVRQSDRLRRAISRLAAALVIQSSAATGCPASPFARLRRLRLTGNGAAQRICAHEARTCKGEAQKCSHFFPYRRGRFTDCRFFSVYYFCNI